MKTSKITVVGSNMVDLITEIDRMPSRGETINGQNFQMGFGGKGANQAVASALMNADVFMMTAVGDDMFGPKTIENLKAYGIDTNACKVIPGHSSGVAPIFVEDSGDNRILIIKGANSFLRPEDVDRNESIIRDSNMVILQLEIDLETVYRCIECCKTHKVPIILNPAPADPNLSLERLDGVNFLIPNESELQALSGCSVDSVEEIEIAARNLIDRGIQNVIATMGENGSLYVSREKTVHVASVSVETIDTTGAGDAFIGCFAAIFCETGDIVGSMTIASEFAGISTTKRGTQISFPKRHELEGL